MPRAEEYSKRVPPEELQCLTPEMREKIKYTPLHEIAGRIADEQIEAFRKQQRGKPKENQRQALAQRWTQLLGAPNLGEAAVSMLKGNESLARVGAQRGLVKTKDVVVPFVKLEPPKRQPSAGVIVAVAQEGKAGFLKHRAETIAKLLDEGATVILPDLPGCGEAANPGEGRGRTSGSTSQSASAQMLGTTMLGLRLHCLQRILEVARLEADGKGPVKLWGDSFAPVNGPDVRIEVPYDVDRTPSLAEPGGPLLALLAGVLSDTPIESIYTRGGLVSFRSILDNQFIYVPHDVAIPGATLAGDLDDLAAAHLSHKGTRLAIEAPVDGLNRAAGQDAINRAYSSAMKAAGKDAVRLRLSAEPSSAAEAAAWLRGASSK